MHPRQWIQTRRGFLRWYDLIILFGILFAIWRIAAGYYYTGGLLLIVYLLIGSSSLNVRRSDAIVHDTIISMSAFHHEVMRSQLEFVDRLQGPCSQCLHAWSAHFIIEGGVAKNRGEGDCHFEEELAGEMIPACTCDEFIPDKDFLIKMVEEPKDGGVDS